MGIELISHLNTQPKAKTNDENVPQSSLTQQNFPTNISMNNQSMEKNQMQNIPKSIWEFSNSNENRQFSSSESIL